jgi:hypothetical protein
VAAGGDRPQVVAAVLLFRVLTYGIQIPLGAFTYMIWRAKTGWRRDEPPDGAQGRRTGDAAAEVQPAGT